MNILFVIDRVELKYFEFNDLVTNFWLIKSFLQRGHNVKITTIDMLKLKSGVAYSSCYDAYFRDGDIFYDKESIKEEKIEDFHLVMFRPDPPVDLDYINATYIFDFVDINIFFYKLGQTLGSLTLVKPNMQSLLLLLASCLAGSLNTPHGESSVTKF